MTYCDDGKYREVEHEEWSPEWVRVVYAVKLRQLTYYRSIFTTGDIRERESAPSFAAENAFMFARIAPNSKEYHAIWEGLPDSEDKHKFKAEVTRYMEEVANGD